MKWVEIMKGLAYLSITIFFSIASWSGYNVYSLGTEKFSEYEARWYKTFHDVDTVSESINRVADVAAPLSASFPRLVAEVHHMNGSVEKMQSSVNRIDKSVSYMAETVPPQMGYMADQIGQIQNRMTPGGMMRKIMP